MKLYCYKKCSTCKKAAAFLRSQGAIFEEIDYTEQPLTVDELHAYWQRSGLALRKFFNTSGLRYKALELKDKLPHMSDEEQFALLATDGMLVKRPLVVGDGFVLAGFKPAEWERLKA